MPALLMFTRSAGYVATTQAKDDPAGRVALDLIEARDRGESLIGRNVPTRYVLQTARKTVPDAFIIHNGFSVVSARLRAVLERFDLGASEFHPLDLLTRKGERAFGDMFILQVCEFKDSLVAEKTQGSAFNHKDFGVVMSVMTVPGVATGVVLDRSALAGVDLWRERREPYHPYMSDRLLAACKAEKMRGLFPGVVVIDG